MTPETVRRSWLSFSLVAGLAAFACAPMTIHTYLETGTDLRHYHTYNWGPSDTWSTGDPRLDNNRFFDERVRQRVEQALEQRGYEKTPSQAPDIQLHYHASVSQDLEARNIDAAYACSRGDCGSQVFDKGTLVIDLVDPRTKKLLWRGWAEGSIDGVIDNQAWMEARVDDVVARILKQLPRAS
jgi:hypothetical protein